MILEKTLNNLRKTKESFFNMERDTLVNLDLLKRGIIVYYHGNFDEYDTTFKLKDTRYYYYPDYLILNKPNNDFDYSPYVMIKSTNEEDINNWIIKLCI